MSRDTNSNGLCGQQEQIPVWKVSIVINPYATVNHPGTNWKMHHFTSSCASPLSISDSLACPLIHHVNIDSSTSPDNIYSDTRSATARVIYQAL